jgi:hypothetical protein
MKRTRIVVAAFLALTQLAGMATTHSIKQVGVIHSPDSRQCTFFTLTGVTEADSVYPGSEWFAVPKGHEGYKEIVSFLAIPA